MPEILIDPDPPDLDEEPPGSPAIVVGVDGSDSSVAAVRYAAGLAPALNLPLHVLSVWDYPTFMDGGFSPALDWSPLDDAKRIVREAALASFDEAPPDWLTLRTRRGRPTEVLIAESRYAEMIVLGSRGHGGFVGLLLGSVSAACAEHAHCPVLVVHGR
ncbi:hypothetical protein GCM10009748_16130 [Agromyces lapidis]